MNHTPICMSYDSFSHIAHLPIYDAQRALHGTSTKLPAIGFELDYRASNEELYVAIRDVHAFPGDVAKPRRINLNGMRTGRDLVARIADVVGSHIQRQDLNLSEATAIDVYSCEVGVAAFTELKQHGN